MTTCLGKSCSFGLSRKPFVNCRQFMYLVVSLYGFEDRIWDLIVSVPDHCFFFFFFFFFFFYIFESFFTIEKIWDRLPFFSQETIYHVRTEMGQSLALLCSVMLDH